MTSPVMFPVAVRRVTFDDDGNVVSVPVGFFTRTDCAAEMMAPLWRSMPLSDRCRCSLEMVDTTDGGEDIVATRMMTDAEWNTTAWSGSDGLDVFVWDRDRGPYGARVLAAIGSGMDRPFLTVYGFTEDLWAAVRRIECGEPVRTVLGVA